jgi:hypothetical protein
VLLLACAVAAAITYAQIWDMLASFQRSVRLLPFRLQPLPGQNARDSSLFDEAYREEMFWGTYRPGFYCGARLPSLRAHLISAMDLVLPVRL